MIDAAGRTIDHLRISLTSRCNLDCFYCHREGNSNNVEMTTKEVRKILKDAKEHGINTLKITGGEPMLRPDILEIVAYAKSLGFSDIGMTTNGTMLAELAPELKHAGLERVNIGCDSIKSLPKNTRTVSDAIKESLSAGLLVKLNMVILKGVNVHEIKEMIVFASEMQVNLQLIELVETDRSVYDQYYYSMIDIEKNMEGEVRVRKMQNRKRFYTGNIFIELVRPSRKFCQKCNKIRVTSDGRYKACLMAQENFSGFDEAIGGRSYGYG